MMTDTAEAPDLPPEADVVLETVPVLARYRTEVTDDEGDAIADVRRRLEPVRELFDDLFVERREDDGAFQVVARFVTVSIDPHVAVLGVHDSLHEAGIPADEVWVQP